MYSAPGLRDRSQPQPGSMLCGSGMQAEILQAPQPMNRMCSLITVPHFAALCLCLARHAGAMLAVGDLTPAYSRSSQKASATADTRLNRWDLVYCGTPLQKARMYALTCKLFVHG